MQYQESSNSFCSWKIYIYISRQYSLSDFTMHVSTSILKLKSRLSRTFTIRTENLFFYKSPQLVVLKSKPLATTNNTRNQLFAIPFFTNTHIGSPRQPQAIGKVILIHFPAKHALLATGTSLNGVVARTNSIAPYCD